MPVNVAFYLRFIFLEPHIMELRNFLINNYLVIKNVSSSSRTVVKSWKSISYFLSEFGLGFGKESVTVK